MGDHYGSMYDFHPCEHCWNEHEGWCDKMISYYANRSERWNKTIHEDLVQCNPCSQYHHPDKENCMVNIAINKLNTIDKVVK